MADRTDQSDRSDQTDQPGEWFTMAESDITHVGGDDTASRGGALEAQCRAAGVDPAGVLDFSTNVNPLGPPQCLERVMSHAVKLAGAYPDAECGEARAALGKAWGVSPRSILLGNGSTGLLHTIMRTFRCDETLILGPASREYARAAELAGSRVEMRIAQPGRLFRHDLAAMGDIRRFHLVVIGNPNDPTGRFTRPTEIIEWAAENPETFFLVDESHMDFLDRPGASLMGIACPAAGATAGNVGNVVVLKSFSMFFAVPGLRLGAVWAAPDVIDVLDSRRERWSVNAFAQKMAAMLYDERGYIAATRILVVQERSFLIRGLTELGFRVFDSAANFLLLKIERRNLTSAVLKEQMLKNGVLVRDCSDFDGLGGQFIRVGVRRHDENERLLEAMEKTLDRN